MSPVHTQFDFLKGYVEALLIQNGFDNLSEQQKEIYVPQILGHLEQRIGIEMLPKLSEEKIKVFAKLLEKESTSPEDWKDFWYGSVENFEEEVKQILLAFAERVKQILA